MKFIDIFAGIGGFHLGMEQAGHECVGWVERDKFARKSYQAIFEMEGVWNTSDIRAVRASEIPRSDCWCFGFPCQDISVAGKQGGFTSGRRSSLFFTVTGLLRGIQKEDRPAYLLIENVKNLLSINNGWDFAKLQVELDEIGYDVEWDVLDSAQVVPQHRERIFIVGHLRGRRTRKVFPIIRKNGETNKTIKEVARIYPNRHSGGGQELKVAVCEATKIGYDFAQLGDSINFSQPNSKTRRGRVGHGVANTLTTSVEQATLMYDLKIRKLTPLEYWRLQGFPDWAFERTKQAGLSDSQLYKQAGNSVTVPVIRLIAERMALTD